MTAGMRLFEFGIDDRSMDRNHMASILVQEKINVVCIVPGLDWNNETTWLPKLSWMLAIKRTSNTFSSVIVGCDFE
jgi:hypothetical protein